MKTANVVCVLIVFCSAWNAETKLFQGILIPEDLQTILNVAYSRLPPIKLGNDKRFGVGFRLGRNADFQVLLELGPQSETVPLRDPTNSLGKRESHKQYNHWDKPKTTVSKTDELKTTTNKLRQYITERPFLTSTTIKKSNNYIDPSTLNSLPSSHYKTLSSPSNSITTEKLSPYKTDRPLLSSTTNKISRHYKIEHPPLNSTTIQKSNYNNTELPNITSNRTSHTTKLPLSSNSVGKEEVNSMAQTGYYKHRNSTTPNNPQSKLNNKTKNQVKTSTNKPILLNSTTKTPESLFSMFINWLTGFTYAI